jgi:hypothetical protein
MACAQRGGGPISVQVLSNDEPFALSNPEDEVDVLERVVGLVVRGQDDDAVFLAGEANNIVAHGLDADRSVGGELVGDEVALGGFRSEVLLDELLGGEMAR